MKRLKMVYGLLYRSNVYISTEKVALANDLVL